MKSLSVEARSELSWEQQKQIIDQYLSEVKSKVRKVLLIPPDYTRKHSGVGPITAYCFKELVNEGVTVDVMPALGTHVPMTSDELTDMFGPDIPMEAFHVHNWRTDTKVIGIIPEDYVEKVSDGHVRFPIEVRVNTKLIDGEYDLIISLGQVLPHEVVGMANYNKNIFVGCGGVDIINKSHFVGAAYGLERLLGRDHSGVRKLYDYAQEHFLTNCPLVYVLTVNTVEVNPETGCTRLLGLYIGDEREVFERAVAHSQKHNITVVEKPLQKVVVNLDSEEFKTTWIGCKAVYRTRMAIADGGELIVIAPGLRTFGEDPAIDKLIRKYGYAGRKSILRWAEENADLQENRSAAAHLIHGSSDGRFQVTFACTMPREEIQGVNFRFMELGEALRKYPIDTLKYGFNQVNGEEIYFIDNPATGLWVSKDRWQN